jgi:hypothetical protein
MGMKPAGGVVNQAHRPAHMVPPPPHVFPSLSRACAHPVLVVVTPAPTIYRPVLTRPSSTQ